MTPHRHMHAAHTHTCKSVSCRRCHESVDRGLLKNLLRMLVDLQLYQDIFEMEFLRETETMYHAESLKMLRDPEFTVRTPVVVVVVVVNIVAVVIVTQLPGAHRKETDSRKRQSFPLSSQDDTVKGHRA